ncbi:Putative histidine phosphatase superfamily, clade-2 [Colletotrichum destructivum]|uniref:Histidine phosphatase superfamily, clade-2 n=1 Tax=Colletotrichum destructivum TaxID=34406 RepID=A0AAX4IES0_9PEZI|nr:Putative histidine phosphatase superfamily, clade-2 [Colletotrichum destructivum]
MGALSLVLLMGALLSTSSAQSSNPSVWASVAMIMHGERTPLRSELQNTLTPRGAQQMYAQGSAFRARYLASGTPTNISEGRITSRAAIRDVARNVIEHEQLSIFSVPDAHVVAGATAFMQGLYPPITQAFAPETGGTNISLSTLSGNLTQYPLGGYQYPVIETLGVLDERSVYIRGNTECPQWRISTTTVMQLDPYMRKLYEASLPGYHLLFSTPPLNDGTISLSNANFWDAYNLYEYVRYRYTHEQAIYDAMKDDYAQQSQFLMMYARQQQLNMTSNKVVSGLKKGDMIRTIAGRTFARKVVDALEANGNYGGYSNKMTIMFSSHEPFMAFFALAQLQQQYQTLLTPFWDIPENGAAMVFELIGDQPNEPNTYPTEDNLYVRFLYRENANPNTSFEEYSLFGLSDADTRMTYSYFKQEMLKFGVDVSTWCSICGSVESFCDWESHTTTTTRPTVGEAIRSDAQKPVVAGIIGAVIVLAALGVLFVMAAVLGGFRIHRKRSVTEPEPRDKDGRVAGFGGFKAAEKMASDPDLTVSKRGVHHERQGSWELHSGRDVTASQAGIVVGKASSTFRGRSMDDDDAVSVIGASPVKPREGV